MLLKDTAISPSYSGNIHTDKRTEALYAFLLVQHLVRFLKRTCLREIDIFFITIWFKNVTGFIGLVTFTIASCLYTWTPSPQNCMLLVADRHYVFVYSFLWFIYGGGLARNEISNVFSSQVHFRFSTDSIRIGLMVPFMAALYSQV